MLEFFKNIAHEKFVVKCVGVLVKSKNKILVMYDSKNPFEMIPFSIPSAGMNQRDHLIKSLKNMQLDLQVDDIPNMKRLILKNGKNIQRINFVLFKGEIKKSTHTTRWKNAKDDSLISALI